MGGKIIKFSDYAQKWREIYHRGSGGASLHIYINDGTGELEIVQVDQDGKSMRTALTTIDAVCLASVISRNHDLLGQHDKK